ncbi:hypothetical protein [Dyella japonica]|nr:hypothetical protein [Dyella japonica]
MDMIELQAAFVRKVIQALKAPWQAVSIHYENYPLNGRRHEVFTSTFEGDGVKEEFRLSLEAIDVLAELQKQKPESQEEWTWVEFSMDHSGKYCFEYKYGVPPFVAEQLRYM